MTDALHIKEINQSILSNSGQLENTILMVGDVIDHELGPSEMGLMGTHETGLQIKILNQFKSDYNLEDTVLTQCHRHREPCYCACAAYRNSAHIFFDCDICKRVPIGRMFVCNVCVPDNVFSCCQDCFKQNGHSCKTNSVGWIDRPLMRNPGRKGMIEMLARWENERKQLLTKPAVVPKENNVTRFGLDHLQSGLVVLFISCCVGYLMRRGF